MYNKLQKKWLKEDANISDKELKIKGYQVMQRWETPYMKDLAEIATSKGGNVLELGFGQGISAGFIQQSKKIIKHIIIEAHPKVVHEAFRLYNKEISEGKMQIFQGFWEDTTIFLKDKSFDGILFDTSPLEQETVFFHFFPFFKEASRLLKDDGIFTYFSDEPTEISSKHAQLLKKAGFNKIDYRVVKINTPDDCHYWKHNTIISPIIKK